MSFAYFRRDHFHAEAMVSTRNGTSEFLLVSGHKVGLNVSLCSPNVDRTCAFFFSEVTVIYLARPQGVTHSYRSHGVHMSDDKALM
jgi:hypothetical protein